MTDWKPTETFRQKLAEWQDWDYAAHALAVSLGLMTADVRFHAEAKHVYWTSNPVGNALHDALNGFVEAGFLERRDEPDIQFRWSKSFAGSWVPRTD